MDDIGGTNLLSIELLSQRDAFVNWIRLFDLNRPWAKPDVTRNLDSVSCPQFYASQAGLIESARLLLEQGPDANAQGGEYGTALLAASYRGHDAIVQRLIEEGAEVD
jgi:ankyrin repeat protein